MPRLTAREVTFLELQTAVLCIECELISYNNSSRCLFCGSTALLSLSRVLGGSLRNGPGARLVTDEMLNRVVDRVLGGFAAIPGTTGDLAHGPTPAEVPMQGIVEQACLRTQAEGAALALWRDGRMVCTAQLGMAPPTGAEVSPIHGISGLCLRTAQTLCCEDTEIDARVDGQACRQLGARSIVAAPLIHMTNTVGLLQVLSSQAQAFDDLHVATVQLMANVAVLAIMHGSLRHRRLQPCGLSSGEPAV